MDNLYNLDTNQWQVILAAFTILLFIGFVILLIRLGTLSRKYKKMINGGRSENVEQVIGDIQSRLNELAAQHKMNNAELTQIKNRMAKMKSNLAINRYNAFSEGGSDLSFSIAIVDEQHNGVVLTGIHGREQTFMYAKPLDKGESNYNLSPEERQVIAQSTEK